MTRRGAHVQSVRTVPSSISQRGVAASPASPLGAVVEADAESWLDDAPSARHPLVGTPRSEARSIPGDLLQHGAPSSQPRVRIARKNRAWMGAPPRPSYARRGLSAVSFRSTSSPSCSSFRMSGSIEVVHLVHKDGELGAQVLLFPASDSLLPIPPLHRASARARLLRCTSLGS